MHGIPLSLLELAAQREAIYTTLTEGIDVDDDEARAALEGMYQNAAARTIEELESWLDDMGVIEEACRADIAGLTEFIKPFSTQVARKERTLETLRRHVHEAMALFQVQKVSTRRAGTWSIVSRPTTEVYDEAGLPRPDEDPALWRVRTELNKTELNERLKAGRAVPGARIIEVPVLQRKR